ncbi:transcriptional regulator, TetR family [Quadrisphaera granulorum]|uniref:TetR family transcriptional regulator n=1 Tax=Quadrisphaera granulorum TaxID=317664 RepID=A0A315ZPU3_9ACTN|nr:TetR family transcriptional regulator [Quadrisphaera granulorum]SZE99000.1 transcriptional regulator, TetR family [Quadrisphaera granulorum]
MNAARRAVLADAAIALLVEAGVHGVTHRAVDKATGLPAGTASNYFPSREALLVAVVDRVVDLHLAQMSPSASSAAGSDEADHLVRQPGKVLDGPAAQRLMTELLAASLLQAATDHRQRYLAIFELQLEALRRPAVREALGRLQVRSTAATSAHYEALGLPVPPDRIPTVLQMYGGVLFTLVSGPVGAMTVESVTPLAAGIARAALTDGGVLHG